MKRLHVAPEPFKLLKYEDMSHVSYLEEHFAMQCDILGPLLQ